MPPPPECDCVNRHPHLVQAQLPRPKRRLSAGRAQQQHLHGNVDQTFAAAHEHQRPPALITAATVGTGATAFMAEQKIVLVPHGPGDPTWPSC